MVRRKACIHLFSLSCCYKAAYAELAHTAATTAGHDHFEQHASTGCYHATARRLLMSRLRTRPAGHCHNRVQTVLHSKLPSSILPSGAQGRNTSHYTPRLHVAGGCASWQAGRHGRSDSHFILQTLCTSCAPWTGTLLRAAPPSTCLDDGCQPHLKRPPAALQHPSFAAAGTLTRFLPGTTQTDTLAQGHP